MNARRYSVAFFGSLLAGTALFAQMPQPGAPASRPRQAQLEENRLRRQNRLAQSAAGGSQMPKEAARLEHQGTKIDLDGARSQGNGQVAMKELARLQQGQSAPIRRIVRQKRDARNVK